MFIHGDLVDRWLAEDVPCGDLTSKALGLNGREGVMEFRARYACTLGGVAEAQAVLERLGLKPSVQRTSGAEVPAGALAMSVAGDAAQLHMGWKVAQNIMEYASGIATATRLMVSRGRAVNPRFVVAATRKNFPGTKLISINAVEAGGGVAHRLGLSETFLLFDNHGAFFATRDELLRALRKAVAELPEKKLAVEASTLEFALGAAAAGIGTIQFEKIKPVQLADWVKQIKAKFPHLTVAAAGGINPENVAEYAATGIDLAVTSSMYNAKPMDIEVKIRPAEAATEAGEEERRTA